MTPFRFHPGILILATFASIVPSSYASILFSTLPATGTNGGYGIVGPTNSSTIYQELAAQFTSTASDTLSNVQITFSHYIGSNNALTIKLYSSVANAPGVVLGTQTIAAGTLTSTSTLYTINLGAIPINGGTSYFLDASTTGDAWQSWDNSASGRTVPVQQINSLGGTFHSVGNLSLAFQVNGVTNATTPEPGTISSVAGGAGVLLFGWLRRRKSKAATASTIRLL